MQPNVEMGHFLNQKLYLLAVYKLHSVFRYIFLTNLDWIDQ